MLNSISRPLVVAAALALLAAPGCSCGDDSPGDLDGSVADASVTDADPTPDADNCLTMSMACTDNTDCCSGYCDDNNVCNDIGGCTPAGDACTTSGECCAGTTCRDDGASGMTCQVGLCGDQGDDCVLDSDCCNLDCDEAGTGKCGDGTNACLVQGTTCNDDTDCCSLNCNGTCSGSAANCDPIGEACTDNNGCCSDFCANDTGAACGAGDSDCRCSLVTSCRPSGELCSDDNQCCNNYCDGLNGGGSFGFCASPGACTVVGEPCGNPGINGSCCSNACLDNGSGVATCTFLGGCLPINEICSADAQCCSGACVPNGTTSDGRDIMRCDSPPNCLDPGEVCGVGASDNCCPNGGGSAGCEPANSGVSRCFGGDGTCVLPGEMCTQSADAGIAGDCCTEPADQLGAIECTDVSGNTICCLPDGESCSFGDFCCSGVCAPDGSGNLVCNPGCVDNANACTANADCCSGCCTDDGAGGQECAPADQCGGCQLGQLGDNCSDQAPCCPGLTCGGDAEFPTCIIM